MVSVVTLLSAAEMRAGQSTFPSAGKAVLTHDERHLRRRLLNLAEGKQVLVDFPNPVVLHSGDVLVLEDGNHVEIQAADEPLYAITSQGNAHLIELAWHIGNRHLAAAIEADRILILRDHVIKAMLERLGARVEEVMAPFNPTRGAYAPPGQEHHHHHADHHHAS